jgi:predicted glutamine amidotransferase
MCRLFLSLNSNNTGEEIKSFIGNGTFDCNPEKSCIDGYGLVWSDANKNYNLYKNTEPFFQDKNYDRVIREIKDSSFVIGHLRNKLCNDKTSIKNTQPFNYNDIFFVHNGEVKEFMNKKALILSMINRKYLQDIKGETDSELILFLYLSFLDVNNNMMEAMKKMFYFFDINNISIVANIICVIKNKLIVSRYTINDIKFPSLYVDYKKIKNKILISTKRMNKLQQLMKINTILLYNC